MWLLLRMMLAMCVRRISIACVAVAHSAATPGVPIAFRPALLPNCVVELTRQFPLLAAPPD